MSASGCRIGFGVELEFGSGSRALLNLTYMKSFLKLCLNITAASLCLLEMAEIAHHITRQTHSTQHTHHT